MQEIIIHTDGASRGNPGNAAIAYVIEGLANHDIEFGEKIGITTNNQAEYQALVAALSAVNEHLLSDYNIKCFADSELMVKQLNGQYKVKDMLLKPHFDAIIDLKNKLVAKGNTVTFTAVRRSDNARADKLGNIALDS
ncbi:ribonuclease HI family protein [Candidatus Berkelbacteria bacterium]|nr:ribonuclease HI family protein [Candidatus Berkelbacteria bacterium]